ncbi:MAG: hypothetical protein OQK77_06565 [Psychromonas sp.]|nr:hypothetical protein [Psychromonas sp.]
MATSKQQSSILTEQELQLLASLSTKPQHIDFSVYSFYLPVKLENFSIYLCDFIEELLIMLSASPCGSVLILPGTIESPSQLKKLRKLLNIRKDIQTFWVGKEPDVAVKLPNLEYCPNQISLQNKINHWQQHISHLFKEWLQNYGVAFITEKPLTNNEQQAKFKKIGLQQIEYFYASVSAAAIENKQLLIIDLNVDGLRFVELLIQLANRDAFPTLILFGELPDNLCRAAYNLAENKGFSILASLPYTPDEKKWLQLLHLLFANTYLTHPPSRSPIKKLTYHIYNIDKQKIDSYLCLYGINKKQAARLRHRKKIINLQSLLDWFPDAMNSDSRYKLAAALNCEFKQLGVWIEKPDKILTTSLLYATLLTVGLSRLPVYWLIENETQLSEDVLKNFPISDIILSENISHQLLGEPSEELLLFLTLAKQKNIRIGATLQQNQGVNDAMSLYGIEFILSL